MLKRAQILLLGAAFGSLSATAPTKTTASTQSSHTCSVKAAATLEEAFNSQDFEGALVLFGLENSSFKYDPTSKEPVLVSTMLPKILSSLHAKQVSVLGVTRASIEQASATTATLHKLGIDYGQFFPNTDTVLALGLGEKTGICHGVLYAGTCSLVQAVLAAITTLNLSPKRIILLDDKMSNHLQMMTLLGLPFTGLYYTEAKPRERTEPKPVSKVDLDPDKLSK